MSKSYAAAWKRIANNSTFSDIIILAALKGFYSRPSNVVSREEIFRGQISKSFTPISNLNRLCNGAWEYQTLDKAFKYIFNNLFYAKRNFAFWGMKQEDIIEEIFGGNPDRFEDFINFLKSVLDMKTRNQYQRFEKRYYSYIFVKQDAVTPIHQAVQAGHVAMVIGQNMARSIDAHEVYFQICGVADSAEADSVNMELIEAGLNIEYFFEPVLDDVIAFGIHPIPSYKRGKLMKYNLLTF